MPSAYLWCPAYALSDPAQVQTALARARRLTQAAGFTLAVSPLLERCLGPGAWLDAALRIDDLSRALEHDLIIAARGGYGCLDLVEGVLGSARQAGPLLLGYSDVTVLHALWRRRRWGETLYGLMPGVPSGQRALESTIALLAGGGLDCTPSAQPEVEVLTHGSATGTLVAGCLRVLAGLVGTPAMPELRGCILALEDIDERPYRIERDLRQLALGGCLDGVLGLVFAAFPAPSPAGYAGASARTLCRSWAERLRIPALFALPFGHHADPLTLACGRRAALSCSARTWSLHIQPRAAQDGAAG